MTAMNSANGAFCPECGHIGFWMGQELQYADFDDVGQPIQTGPSYMAWAPFCPECKKLLYIDEIYRENMEKRSDAMEFALEMGYDPEAHRYEHE